MGHAPITDSIDTIISTGMHPILKKAGFKKAGRGFWRPMNDLFQCIAVQGSLENWDDTGKFTVNIGVSSPEVTRLAYGDYANQSPSSSNNWLWSERIGPLMPQRQDQWWVVSSGTNLDAVARDLARAVDRYALPYFSDGRWESLAGVLQALEARGARREYTYVCLLLRVGRIDDARAALEDLYLHSLQPFARPSDRKRCLEFVQRIRIDFTPPAAMIPEWVER